MEKVKIKIDNKSFQVEAGKTILEVAREKGIKIPNLCEHPDFCALDAVHCVERVPGGVRDSRAGGGRPPGAHSIPPHLAQYPVAHRC